jgi:hypothetical protein
MHARNSGAADPFVTLLLSMLTQLANIVLFRLTMDKYREHPNVLPRAEVFIAAIQAHRARMASLIAGTWELADPSVPALLAHLAREGAVERVDQDRYALKQALEEFRRAVEDTLRELGSATPAQFRDRLGLTRKYLIPLLEWADRRGITSRKGDTRVLRS